MCKGRYLNLNTYLDPFIDCSLVSGDARLAGLKRDQITMVSVMVVHVILAFGTCM